MKCSAWKAVPAAALLFFIVCGPAKAQDGDNDGCSAATLHGDYAFTLHGESLGILVSQGVGVPPKLVPFASPLPADGVAITHFDGKGGLSQVDWVMRTERRRLYQGLPSRRMGFAPRRQARTP